MSNWILSLGNKGVRQIFLIYINVLLVGLFLFYFVVDTELFYTYAFNGNFFSNEQSIGCDGLSYLFATLSLILVLVGHLLNWTGSYSVNSFIFMLFGITLFSVSIFLIYDIMFFYIMFEVFLLPLFFFIGIWGSNSRSVVASFNLFLYTVVGSFFMFIGLMCLYSQCGTFDLYTLILYNMSFQSELFVCVLFLIAFAVNTPMFPFHLWLPEAHVEATTVGSVILAGLILNLALYGLCSFVIPLFFLSINYMAPFFYVAIIIGIMHSVCLSCSQCDINNAIAYMSIAHMNFTLIGVFSLNSLGIQGCIYLLVGHGLVSSGLFILVGILYDRFNTRVIFYYGGIGQILPVWAFFYFLFILANFGFPGFLNFVGEALLFFSCLSNSYLLSLLLAVSMVISTGGSVWMYNSIVFGEINQIGGLNIKNNNQNNLNNKWSSSYVVEVNNVGVFGRSDLTWSEVNILSILLILVVILGILPWFGEFSIGFFCLLF